MYHVDLNIGKRTVHTFFPQTYQLPSPKQAREVKRALPHVRVISSFFAKCMCGGGGDSLPKEVVGSKKRTVNGHLSRDTSF